MTDSELVYKARDGDVEAFSRLVEKYANAVYGVAYHSIGDFHQAQDVAQEVFLDAYLKLNTLNQPEKVGSWLYTLTKRCSVDWQRQNKDWKFHSLAIMMPENKVPDVDIKVDVWKALDTLPNQTRLLVILHYIAGFKTKELADFIGTTINAVTNRLYRARRLLKKELLGMVEDSANKNSLGEEFSERIRELLKAHSNMLSEGKQKEALDVIREATRLDPNDKALRIKLADSLSTVGSNTDNSDLLAEAEQEYLKIAEKTPDIYQSLGYVYMSQRRYDQAIECFEKINTISGKVSLAQAYNRKGDYDQAEKAFQSVILSSMQKVNLGLRGLAQVYQANGNVDKAEMVYDILMNFLSSVDREWLFRNARWRAYESQASLYIKVGANERAAESLSKAFNEIKQTIKGDRNTVIFSRLEIFTSRTGEGTDLDWFVKDITSGRFNGLKGNRCYDDIVSEATVMVDMQNRDK